MNMSSVLSIWKNQMHLQCQTAVSSLPERWWRTQCQPGKAPGISQSTRRRARMQHPVPESEGKSGRKRCNLASEVPSSQWCSAAHENPLEVIAVGKVSINGLFTLKMQHSRPRNSSVATELSGDILSEGSLCKNEHEITDLGYLPLENKLLIGSANWDISVGRTEQNVGLWGSFLTARCGCSDSGTLHVSMRDCYQLPPQHPAYGTMSGTLDPKLFLLCLLSISSHAKPQAIPTPGL